MEEKDAVVLVVGRGVRTEPLLDDNLKDDDDDDESNNEADRNDSKLDLAVGD